MATRIIATLDAPPVERYPPDQHLFVWGDRADYDWLRWRLRDFPRPCGCASAITRSAPFSWTAFRNAAKAALLKREGSAAGR